MKLKRFGRWITLLLASVFVFGCFSLAACDGNAEEPGGDATDAPGTWKESSYSYVDASGANATLNYAVYVPTSYTAGMKLPLITYMADSTYVGRGLNLVEKAVCPQNWATAEKMSKTPTFFLVFDFQVTGSDVTIEGSEAAQIVPIINQVVAEYGIDDSRLYLTGQSMGGITDFSLNDAYPDMFAATVYVGCQPGSEPFDDQYWEIIGREHFVNQKFIYIASRLDEKAPYGMDDVEEVLISHDIAYGKLYDLDHQDLDATNALIKAVLDEGHAQNFFGFKQLTSTGVGAAEHMQSFKYCYALDAIYEWLIAQ